MAKTSSTGDQKQHPKRRIKAPLLKGLPEFSPEIPLEIRQHLDEQLAKHDEMLQRVRARFDKPKNDGSTVLNWPTEIAEGLGEEVKWANSYERLPVLMKWLELAEANGGLRQWFTELGKRWTGCDNLTKHQRELVDTFNRYPGLWSKMMRTEERKAFDALPDSITIYRGCGPSNRVGLSWSLRREIAAKFPFYNRYRVAVPLLLEAKIPKYRAVALKLDRNEFELIALVQESDITMQKPLTGTSQKPEQAVLLT